MKLKQLHNQDYFAVFSYAFFILLIILSLVYAKERILISDPAFYFFNMVNSADFFIPHTRSTAVVTQFLTVAAARLELPLAFLLSLYSVSFVLVRLFYFYLVNNVLKNRTAGFAVIAVSAVGIAESYFRPTSESHLALLNSILVYAWLCYANQRISRVWKEKVLNLTVVFLLVFFGYISHPLGLFSLLFSFSFFIIAKRKGRDIVPYLGILFTLIFFLFKIFIGDKDPSHQSLYGNVVASPFLILKELHHYYPYKFFVEHFNAIFLPVAALFLFSVFLLCKKRRILTCVFVIVYSLAYFIVACTSYKYGDANMQMEKIFLPLVMFSAIASGEAITSFSSRWRTVLGGTCVFLILFGLTKINNFLPVYKGRIDTIQNKIVKVADQLENRKMVITYEQIKDYPLLGSWAFGIETLILSELDEETEPLTIFLTDDLSGIEERMKLQDNFMPVQFQTSMNYSALNKLYFNLPEQEYTQWSVNFDFTDSNFDSN